MSRWIRSGLGYEVEGDRRRSAGDESWRWKSEKTETDPTWKKETDANGSNGTDSNRTDRNRRGVCALRDGVDGVVEGLASAAAPASRRAQIYPPPIPHPPIAPHPPIPPSPIPPMGSA